ncbi:hypothetical protein D3C83_170050 [compost metagenome]
MVPSASESIRWRTPARCSKRASGCRAHIRAITCWKYASSGVFGGGNWGVASGRIICAIEANGVVP